MSVREWQQEARGLFWPCVDADEVRDAFRALWRTMEHAEDAALCAVLDELGAAVRRFGEGEALALEARG